MSALAAGPSLDKDPRRIADMFDAIAHRYDQLNRMLSVGLDRQWRRRAVEALELPSGARVLDVCTGTADLAMMAARQVSMPRLVVGVDFAGEMLALGQDKLRGTGLDKTILLARGDACRLPCLANSVDAVTMGFGIRNVADTGAAVAEIFRVLKPGGSLALLEFGEPTLPAVRFLYLWYFRRVLPRVGRVLSRHSEAYAYLPASVSAFLAPEALVGLLRRSGFCEVRLDRLTFGAVCLYSGQKSPEA